MKTRHAAQWLVMAGGLLVGLASCQQDMTASGTRGTESVPGAGQTTCSDQPVLLDSTAGLTADVCYKIATAVPQESDRLPSALYCQTFNKGTAFSSAIDAVITNVKTLAVQLKGKQTAADAATAIQSMLSQNPSGALSDLLNFAYKIFTTQDPFKSEALVADKINKLANYTGDKVAQEVAADGKTDVTGIPSPDDNSQDWVACVSLNELLLSESAAPASAQAQQQPQNQTQVTSGNGPVITTPLF